MLEPGIIPSSEPLIRVGIVLPEDAYTSVNMVTPDDAEYQLSFSGRNIPLAGGTDLFFKISHILLCFIA